MGLVQLIFELVCVAIDVTTFFVVVRLILSRWPVHWLGPLDNIGKRLVDSFADAVENFRRKISIATLTPRGRLVWGLIALMVLRVVIASFAGLHYK
jgi:hypothetical protein